MESQSVAYSLGETIHSVSVDNLPVIENLLYFKYLGEPNLNLGFWVELAEMAVK